VQECALRWRSHAERMEALNVTLGDRLYVACYERLITDTQDVVAELEQFLKLPSPLQVPQVKVEALDRWKSELSAEVLEKIDAVIGDHWVECYRSPRSPLE